jgi:hypothetical protein
MGSHRRAYCSATDRNVPVAIMPGARLGKVPSVQDAEILICLDFGVRCTGAMCPLFTPIRLKGLAEAGSTPTHSRAPR